jgi:hypothetical protein
LLLVGVGAARGAGAAPPPTGDSTVPEYQGKQ